MSQENDESFEIELNGTAMLVIPLADGSFNVYKYESLYCNVFADIGIDTEPLWATGHLVDQQEVDDIGYAIEMKLM